VDLVGKRPWGYHRISAREIVTAQMGNAVAADHAMGMSAVMMISAQVHAKVVFGALARITTITVGLKAATDARMATACTLAGMESVVTVASVGNPVTGALRIRLVLR